MNGTQRFWIRLVAVVASAACFFSCINRGVLDAPTSPTNWEYKVLYEIAAGQDVKSAEGVQLNEADLNTLGKAGWQVSAAYIENETVFPNLGDPKYVNGIQSNVRPKRVVVIFRRPLMMTK